MLKPFTEDPSRKTPFTEDVFTEDVIQTWVEYKRVKELDPLRLRPHPHEFALYFDA